MRDLVREFARQGHSPTVVVPTNPLAKSWTVDRELEGVTVLRCRTPPTKDVGYIKRTINEMRLPHVLLRALHESGLFDEQWDGVVWYSPTIFFAPIVRALRRRNDCRTYLILMDIFPKWALDIGLMRRGPVYYFFKFFEWRQYKEADTIGVQAAGTLAYFATWAKRRSGRRAEVLESWLAESPNVGCPIDIDLTPLARRTIFVYTGNMGIAQGLNIFLDAAAILRDEPNIGFLFVGRGSESESLAARAKVEHLDNVLFHDEIDPSAIPGLLAQCHVGIVALDPRLHTHNIPGKFLSYAQAGLAILARINPGNELERLIHGNDIGRASSSNDATILAEMARDIASNSTLLEGMRARSKALFGRRFSPAVAVQQIVNALR